MGGPFTASNGLLCVAVLTASTATRAADLAISIPTANKAEAEITAVYLEQVSGKNILHPEPQKISLKNFKFSPPLIVLVQGESVDFRNDDITYHTVVSQSPAKTFEIKYTANEKTVVQFDKPGEVKLVCTLHESMRSTILVLKNAYFAQPDVSGQAMIRNVPPGNYVVKLYRVGAAEKSINIKVPAKAKAPVPISF